MSENHDNLFQYTLRQGDTSLVLGHRLSEWCGHAPAMEEDVALANLALDFIGQARILLRYAGEVEDAGRSEDSLAYLRDGRDYRNLLLAEQPNGEQQISVIAADAAMAIDNARDLYTRRKEGVSIWVLPSAAISASDPDHKHALFDPADDKIYRHPTFYEIPDEVKNL